MSNRSLYLFAATVGSFIGGYVPTFWGGSAFSMASILLSMAGGLLALWLAYKYTAG